MHEIRLAQSYYDWICIRVYATAVRYEWSTILRTIYGQCKLKQVRLRLLGFKLDLSDKPKGEIEFSLQASADFFCAPGMDEQGIPGACAEFRNAYIMGIIMLLCIIANLIMQGVGLFLIKEYMKKPKNQYRLTAFFLDLIGGILMLMVLIHYVAIIPWDRVRVILVGCNFKYNPYYSGESWGYGLLCFFIIIQAISIVLFIIGSESSEAREAELKEQKKFLQEQELFQQVEIAAVSQMEETSG